MTLDLRRLRVLQAVASEGSLSGAARLLDYTQPAIGHHIRRLEAEVGTPLVLRRGRGVTLTPAGRALAARADGLLAAAASAEEEIATLAGLRGGRVRLVSFPSASATLVPPALARLRDAHPELQVTLEEAEPPEAVAALLAGDADVAIAFQHPGLELDPDAGLRREVLLEDEKLVVLPPGHRAAASEAVRLKALADETWIAGCPRCRGHLVHLAERAGFTPRIAYSTDDYVAVQGMVAAGLGVALLPSLVLDVVRRDDIAVRPLTPRAARTISAVTLEGAATVPSVRALLDAVRWKP